MRTIAMLCYFSLAALLPTVDAAYAANGPGSLADGFVSAVRGKSMERRLALLHPASRACVTDETRPFFDWIFSRQLNYVIPGDYQVSSQPLKAPPVLPDRTAYPVIPTHQLQIDFKTGPYSSTGVVLMAIEKDGQWKEVLPCPSAEAVAGAKRSSEERKRQEQRIEASYTRLADPLRSELRVLLTQGKKLDAIRRYAAASGEELVIAKGVIERLGESK